MWRSSWQLGKQEIPTPSRSSSPLCLLRPAQTVILKSTKGRRRRTREEDVLLVVDPKLPSHQELLHTTP
ncbi:hypothetical protein Taro_015877, partial [Colocasia esculenta]|nr:hypothetical protein [Colocasia esculenta]